ncbi:TPA: hypothetical protein HA265_04450 [Candidatus Woesearchaeota archaeon]|nr:hypothetical protein [Candidatus Woesearchaeota archaeon]
MNRETYKAPQSFSYTIQVYADPNNIVELAIAYDGRDGFARLTKHRKTFAQELPARDLKQLLEEAHKGAAIRMFDKRTNKEFQLTMSGRFMDMRWGDQPRYERTRANEYTCVYLLNGEEERYTMIRDGNLVIITSEHDRRMTRFPVERVAQRIDAASIQATELAASSRDEKTLLKMLRRGALLFYIDKGQRYPWEERK